MKDDISVAKEQNLMLYKQKQQLNDDLEMLLEEEGEGDSPAEEKTEDNFGNWVAK